MPKTTAQTHTPGPWTVVTPYKYEGTYEIAEAISEHHKANARLIEAAPDLLEALRSLLFVSVQWAAHNNADVSAWPEITHARTAIAKAEGRE